MQDNGHTDEDWDLAREGITLLLNNKQLEAEDLFARGKDNVHMAAGHCFVTFLNALMTFEDDKLQESLQALRDMEKRCAQDVGWLKAVRNRVFGSATDERSPSDRLEEQIILADSQVCAALLTFLQQDMSSYVRGGWALRKAWKVYQHTYTQILQLYKRTFGVTETVPGSDFPSWQVITRDSSLANLQSPCEWSVPTGTTPTASIPGNGVRGFFGSGLRSPLSIFSSLAFSATQPEDCIPPHIVARLMAAVSFGYGVFQLCVSLLPPNILRFIHFLGFEGDRTTGLNALMFTRQSKDFRAPLATLALLWYQTIVRPFFALDGQDTRAGLESAEQLIADSTEFSQSALFLFFEGRIFRLKRNMVEALRRYQAAVDSNPQREVQLLCLHEVGWCHLILLDWENAHSCFYTLMQRSRWSHIFYAYMVAITAGSSGNTDESLNIIDELCSTITPPKEEGDEGSQTGLSTLEIFIWRRVSRFPKPSCSDSSDSGHSADSECQDFGITYCRLLCLECLYLWNALPSCDDEHLNLAFEECVQGTPQTEPMVGLRYLLIGAVWEIRNKRNEAITSFQQCLEMRGFPDETSNDCRDRHVTVFALYELGNLLCQSAETREEGKNLLQKAQEYKEYDSESRLTVRIHTALRRAKQLAKSEEHLQDQSRENDP